MSLKTPELTPALAGARVLCTAQRRSDELAAALVRRGAEVTIASTLGVVPHIDEQKLMKRTQEIVDNPVDTLVVTTAIGFRSWLDTAETVGLYDELLASLRHTRVIARGPKAKGALQAVGLRADWVAESETSVEIMEVLSSEGVTGQRIAIQHHGAGDPMMEGTLRNAGGSVISLEVYKWGPPADPERVRESVTDVGDGLYDAVLFTSAPGSLAWLEEVEKQSLTSHVRELSDSGRLHLMAVGPMTADPLNLAGMKVVFPDRSRMGALVRLVITTMGDVESGVQTRGGLLHIRAASATLDHRRLPVSKSGLAILRRLAQRPGEVVSREELLRVLPGDSADPHTAEVAVARLREALGVRSVIKTVIKRGYVLEMF